MNNLFVKVRFVGKFASCPGETLIWNRKVKKGTGLLKILSLILREGVSPYCKVYDHGIGRLSPYHLLIVNGEIVLPEQFGNVAIEKNSLIEIIPFVSGG